MKASSGGQLLRLQLFANNFAVCTRISNEFSLIIDVTYDVAWPNLINILRAANAPYVHIDLTNRPFLRAFLKFIEHTGTYDAALIFSDERGTSNGFFQTNQKVFITIKNHHRYQPTEQIEGIYEVLNQYSIRSITYDGINDITAERIIRMRPIPTNFAILATAEKMSNLLEQASSFNPHELAV